MRVLITAGGTSEPIDQVRSITNHSTGRLGKALAENFLNSGNWQVDYLTTKHAVLPETHDNLSFYFIESTQELLDTLTNLLTSNVYDAVIHSMAVSDFTTEHAFSEEAFLAKIESRLPITNKESLQFLLDNLEASGNTESKISSDTNRLILTLKKTPKVIQQIKKIQPKTLLVGFKLLVDVSEEELLNVAQASMEKNQADFILANDLTEISSNKHHGYLLAKNGEVTEAYTKIEIAELIRKKIEEKTIEG